MRCIFCKQDSGKSLSVEHIIPESLGNVSHVLPPGVVCDACNNYFSRKVEKPFLESATVRQLRFYQEIPSKRGKVPALEGIITPGCPAVVRRDPKAEVIASVEVPPEAIGHILSVKKGMLVCPASAPPPENLIVSRFLAKVAIEAMARRLCNYPEGLEYLVGESQLDPIRDHARRGDIRDWPVHLRRIYDADKQWMEGDGTEVQRVHEFDILHTTWNEWFFVLAVFGLELVINYGGPEIDGYSRWLGEHDGVSPLYWGKNAGG